MGSRSGSEKRQLSGQLTARVSEQTYATIKAQADDAGVELATWLRGRFDAIAADCAAAPKRRRSKRAPLPLDIVAAKELAGHVAQLCGAIMLMLGRERLPLQRIDRAELRCIYDELVQIKGRLVALVRDVPK